MLVWRSITLWSRPVRQSFNFSKYLKIHPVQFNDLTSIRLCQYESENTPKYFFRYLTYYNKFIQYRIVSLLTTHVQYMYKLLFWLLGLSLCVLWYFALQKEIRGDYFYEAYCMLLNFSARQSIFVHVWMYFNFKTVGNPLAFTYAMLWPWLE